MALVSNSGPMLSLERARRFDLLREGVSSRAIPEAVYADIVIRGVGKVLTPPTCRMPRRS
jgi:hypothetical protein